MNIDKETLLRAYQEKVEIILKEGGGQLGDKLMTALEEELDRFTRESSMDAPWDYQAMLNYVPEGTRVPEKIVRGIKRSFDRRGRGDPITTPRELQGYARSKEERGMYIGRDGLRRVLGNHFMGFGPKSIDTLFRYLSARGHDLDTF